MTSRSIFIFIIRIKLITLIFRIISLYFCIKLFIWNTDGKGKFCPYPSILQRLCAFICCRSLCNLFHFFCAPWDIETVLHSHPEAFGFRAGGWTHACILLMVCTPRMANYDYYLSLPVLACVGFNVLLSRVNTFLAHNVRRFNGRLLISYWLLNFVDM